MNPIFDLGELVRVPGIFLNSNGSAVIDPTVVMFDYHAVALSLTTTYTYGSDAAIVKDSTGRYHVDVNTNEGSGDYFYRFYSTGTGQATGAGEFYVRPRQF